MRFLVVSVISKKFEVREIMKNKNLKPLVSVLIPVFNGAHFLQQTIKSIEKSTYKNLEIILVDDGSRESCKKHIRKILPSFPNVRFFEFAKNRGMTRVLNYGIKQARGKYIARINQDDLMVENRIKLQVEFLESHPDYTALGGQIELFTNEGKIIDTVNFPLDDAAIKSYWYMLSPFSDPTVMYRKDDFAKTHGYSQYFWPADDVHMWYQLGSLGKLANLPQVLTKVRWHNDSGSIKYHKLQMEKTWQVHLWALKNFNNIPFGVIVFWILQYIAGKIFPPRFNWWVFRQIKKLQNTDFYQYFRRTLGTISIVKKVITQPKTASLSGV